MKQFSLICLLLAALPGSARALEKPDLTYQVFQFPADKIPRVDGDDTDWDMVPESYVIGQDQLVNDCKEPPAAGDKTLAVRVKVGWVKGLNRLYFLYETEDDFWEFDGPGLRNDTFEVIVDGDASGGPFIGRDQNRFWTPEHVGEPAAKPEPRISDSDLKWAVHGVHAQNYHIMTPAVDKDWTMAWGSGTWTKELPWANSAQSFLFKHGESGKYIVEFWITPFDYAGPEGPARAIESVLTENKVIGPVLDCDRLRREDPARLLDALAEAPVLRPCLRAVRLPAHAARRLARPEARRPMVLVGGGHGPPPSCVQGPVGRHHYRLEMGFRRRHHLQRAAPAPRLRQTRQLRDHSRHHRP